MTGIKQNKHQARTTFGNRCSKEIKHYEKGKEITGLNDVDEDVVVFHAGTAFNENKEIVTDGGRVLGVSARGKDIAEAIKNAYLAVEKISFDGAQYRKDIGRKALKRLEK